MTSLDEAFYRTIVEGAGDLIVAFDDTGTMVYANETSASMLGLPLGSLVGRSVFDFIHPDDLERAMIALELNVEFGSAPGTTVFRLAHADGSWVFVDMTGGHASDDGRRTLFTSFSRIADDQFSITETLMRLLDGSSVADALRPVVDIFAWEGNGSQIGITWSGADGASSGAISTGIDLELVGAASEGTFADEVSPSPWDQVARSGESFIDLDLSQLPDRLQTLAADAGMSAYWIEPIRPDTAQTALVTVWTRKGGRPPLNHAHAMAIIKPIVEVILRWCEQQRLLDFAANHDALTGVANRHRFFDAIAACEVGGAVLYCDLDRFKAVNDELGHPAGDELLCQVAARLVQCVRAEDLVARLGGDEFAVLCPGASPTVSGAIAQRIEAALDEPFEVAGRPVGIGVSVGIGQSEDPISAGTLDQADQALYRVKGDRRTGDRR